MIDGQKITHIRTLGSKYDGNCVEVRVEDKYYRMPCSTIIQMVNEFEFQEEKKKVHIHLTKTKLKGGE